MNKKVIASICAVLVCALIGLKLFVLKDNKKDNKTSNENSNSNVLKELPKPEVTGGQRGQLGIDKNINESNIDEYLNREDSVYRDMRMLEDPANYENIGGDRFLSGYIKGFEVIPLPYLIPVEGLPDEVGKTYAGKTLFSLVDGKYEANYEESMKIIEEIFPKDKVIFLMCGGGGYAGMTKQFLVSLGWDENKIYNIGGYWYYEGKNNVEVKKVVDGKTIYDFDNVPYHKIEFDKLTKIDKRVELSSEFYNYDNNQPYDKRDKNSMMFKFDMIDTREGTWTGHHMCGEGETPNKNGCFTERTEAQYEEDIKKSIEMKGALINDLLKEKKSFVVILHAGDTCISYGGPSSSFEQYVQDYLNNKKVYSFVMGLFPHKKTELYKTVKYNPAVIIVRNGEIYKYIDNNMDEYTKYSKDKNAAIKWIEENVVIK